MPNNSRRRQTNAICRGAKRYYYYHFSCCCHLTSRRVYVYIPCRVGRGFFPVFFFLSQVSHSNVSLDNIPTLVRDRLFTSITTCQQCVHNKPVRVLYTQFIIRSISFPRSLPPTRPPQTSYTRTCTYLDTRECGAVARTGGKK